MKDCISTWEIMLKQKCKHYCCRVCANAKRPHDTNNVYIFDWAIAYGRILFVIHYRMAGDITSSENVCQCEIIKLHLTSY